MDGILVLTSVSTPPLGLSARSTRYAPSKRSKPDLNEQVVQFFL